MGQAYEAISNESIAFPGGICDGVGVGGISTGGDQSFFLPKVGWVVDNTGSSPDGPTQLAMTCCTRPQLRGLSKSHKPPPNSGP